MVLSLTGLEVIPAFCWDLGGTVDQITFIWTLHAAWAFPRHGDWVPGVGVLRERERESQAEAV